MRNREENAVLPERYGVRLNKFDAIQALVANALFLFRNLRAQKAPPAIARAKGAISASYQVALPVPPRTGVTQWWSWTPNMGVSAGLCSDFLDRF